jgi:2-aminoadipate transaminase
MAQVAGARWARWLADGAESAADQAVSSRSALGLGADLIGFGGGQPASESYPLEALARAYQRAIIDDGRAVLPYGPSEGLEALRQIVAERLAQRGIAVSPEQVLIVTGSIQSLHLVGLATLDFGSTIVTEAPTFMGALGTWEYQMPRYLSIAVDEHGLQVDALAETVSQMTERPRFVYLQPTFQNPSGVSLTLARRERLLDVAREYDLVIVEDDPYGEFWFDDGTPPIPPLRSLPGSEHNVVYLGTFSKILAPGVRLAYAVAEPDMLARLARAKRGVDFHTDTLLQQAVVHLVRDPEFDLEAHIREGRALYKARRDAMLDALETTFSGDTRWTRPAGGFFLWLDLPSDVSADAVAAVALGEGVAVFAGSIFYPNGDGGFNGIRLSYANATPDRIREGITRLHRAFTSVSA